ncbi:MAG TPA: mucoidy inhibitor MuiA family protein [Bacteroidales bacterium]
MKKTGIVSIFIFSAALNLFAQTEKEINAEIKHVTVFPDRAQIDHEASVLLLPGKTILKLSGLSPYIDAQSIQVKGFGEFTILSVNQQHNYLQNLEDAPEVKNIRSQIEMLQLKVEDETTAISILKEKGSFLTANKAVLDKKTTFTIEQFKSMMDLYTSNMEQIALAILKKERLIKDYGKQITALQQQIADKLGKQKLPSGEILVTVSSEKQVSGKISFSYVVSNAGWYPSYDIRVDDIKNPVVIFYKANVFQNSGVAWKDVKLSFSNATPWISGDIPSLYPWFIDYYNPPSIRIRGYGDARKSNAPVMMDMATPAAKMEEKAMASEAAPVVVEKQVGETTITFDVAVPYTIPSDGKIQTVEIQRLTAPAEYKYVSLPKLSPLAYLTANITDWSKFSLQSGEATLYFENSFVGKSTLNVNQLTDTLTISLGTDNSILVKREKRKDFTSKKTIGANKTDTYSFLITVRNNKSTPVKLTLNDQIPISSNSGITVESNELSAGRYNAVTGEIKWDLEINSQETKQITLTYSVKYPKDKTVVLE